MKSLVYLSRNTSVEQQELDAMVECFNLKNKQHEITGYLIERHGDFIQYLEGPVHSVDRLLSIIRQDKRHRVLFVVERKLNKRLFPQWHMRLMSECTQVEDMLFAVLHERLIKAKRWYESSLRFLSRLFYVKKVWNSIDNLALVVILNDINPPHDTYRY